MYETLHERFRPFKPYDRALALILVVLIAMSGEAGWAQRLIIAAGGILLFSLLDAGQRFVRVPTPLWQALVVVCLNTTLVTLLVAHLQPSHRLASSLYILNVAFATVAFGRAIGLASMGLSLMVFCVVDPSVRPWTEWTLLAVLLLALIFFLGRVVNLQHEALTDALTHLRNHRFFQMRLREELERTARYDRPTALAILDLDDFKRINDRFGHAAGDRILNQLARTLEEQVRGGDVVCRYGGEEFVVILPETSLGDACQSADRWRNAVAVRFAAPFAMTISVGVAVSPQNGTTPDHLIAAADTALYAAKRAGKNRVQAAEQRSVAAQD